MNGLTLFRRFGVDAAVVAAGNGPDGTQNYVPVTIQASQVPSALADFRAYVRMSDLPAAFFTNVQADGGDIRVTEDDGTTRAPVDLVSIDKGGSTGELHFKASSVSASSNTTYRIYYNATSTLSQPAVGDTYGRNAVWTGYLGVWHLNADPTDAAPQFVDSTGNGYDGTANGSMTSADRVVGQLGQAIDFDGTDDRIEMGDYAAGGIATGYALSAWVKKSSSGTDYIIDGDDSGGAEDRAWQYLVNINGVLVFRRFDASSNSVVVFGGATDLRDAAWHHTTAVFDATSGSVLYVDGSSDATDANTTENNDTDGVYGAIGARIDTSEGGTVKDPFLGVIDEARIRTSPVSAAWVSAEHTNQNTPLTFYSVGTEQAA